MNDLSEKAYTEHSEPRLSSQVNECETLADMCEGIRNRLKKMCERLEGAQPESITKNAEAPKPNPSAHLIRLDRASMRCREAITEAQQLLEELEGMI
jgi:hypothetical protein